MQRIDHTSAETFDANDWRIGIVTAEFNSDITGQLEKSAIMRAAEYGINDARIDVLKVAGAIEVPLVLQQMAASGKYSALLAVGCVIRGETPHFDYVCQFVTDGILRVQLDHSMPIGFGVLTCNTLEEAMSRANLGGDHLDAVLHQVRAIQSI